jgi:hypothetical protein
MPSPPSRLQVFTLDGGATAQLTWNGDPNAYQYGIYTHYLLEADQPYKLWFEQPSVPCISMGDMYPGTWHYEFCVVAFNGNFSSEMSECVTGSETFTSVGACPTPVGTAAAVPYPTVGWSNPSPTSIVPSGGSGSSPTGGGGGGGGGIVYINPTIWAEPNPAISCTPPCTFVLPPWTIPTLTTIEVPPQTATIEETWPSTTNGVINYVTSTIVTVIVIPAVTTSVIPVFNIIWSPPSGSSSTVIPVYTSIYPLAVTLTEDTGPEQQAGVTYTYNPGPFPTVSHVSPPYKMSQFSWNILH